MTMDNRFPYLERFSNYRGASKHAQACVTSVEERTGTSAIINMQSGRIIFRYGDNIGGPLGVPLEHVEHWTGGDVDAAVHTICYAKNASRDEKDKVVSQQDKESKEGEAKQLQSVCDNARPDVVDHAAHLDRARRGTEKVTSLPA